MSRPIVEPSTPGRVTGLGYDTRQLQRRPSPVSATPGESGLTRGAPIHTELISVQNALPASDTFFKQFPFDLTFGGTTPVGSDVGNGTPYPPDQYFDFDAENCCIGLPMGGIVLYEARFAAANVPDIGTTWSMAVMSERQGDCTTYDPDSDFTFFGVAPENVSNYNAADLVITTAVWRRELFSTTLDEERQWLQFYYMHDGPEVEDTNFSRLDLELSFWPAGYVWNTNVFQGFTNGKGILVIEPAVPEEVNPGATVTVTFAGEENPTDTDWIAMFPLGGDTVDFEGNWIYTNSGTQTAGATAVSEGTWPMTAPMTPGDYQVRWMYNDTVGVLVEGNSFIRVMGS